MGHPPLYGYVYSLPHTHEGFAFRELESVACLAAHFITVRYTTKTTNGPKNAQNMPK